MAVLAALDQKAASDAKVARTAETLWLQVAENAFEGADRVPASRLIADGLLLIGDGYRAKNTELGSAGVPFLRAANLTDNGVVFAGADHLPLAAMARVGQKRAVPRDTAFTSKGTIGRMTLISDRSFECVYSPQVCYWRSMDPSRVSPFVLHAWMRSPRFMLR